MKSDRLVEGPLSANEYKGWIDNPVANKKRWSSEEVRIIIDTKQMNDQLIKAKMSIPTTEELQHDLQGSDQFSALNCRDSIFHFRLDKKSQELFKFQGHNGVYRFLALVMKTRRRPKNDMPQCPRS